MFRRSSKEAPEIQSATRGQGGGGLRTLKCKKLSIKTIFFSGP